MKTSLSLILSILIAMPVRGAEQVHVDQGEIAAYIAAQREMIEAFEVPYRRAKAMKAALNELEYQNKNGWIFSRDELVVAEKIKKYQQAFSEFRQGVKDDEWKQRQREAWEKAEQSDYKTTGLMNKWADDVKAQEIARLEKIKQQKLERAEELRRQEMAILEARLASAKNAVAKIEQEKNRRIEQVETASLGPDTRHAELWKDRTEQKPAEPQAAPAVVQTEKTGEKPFSKVTEGMKPWSDTDFQGTQVAERMFQSPEYEPNRTDYLMRSQEAKQNEQAALLKYGVDRARADLNSGKPTMVAGSVRMKDDLMAKPEVGAGSRKLQEGLPPSALKQDSESGNSAPSVSYKDLRAEIQKIARNSGCIGAGRSGHAVTSKYLFGLTEGYARAMCRPYNDPVRTAMTGSQATQVASADGSFQIPSNDNKLNGIFQNILSLGLYESDGRFGEGRDLSASNTSGETTEAGFLQTSYNVHACNRSGGWSKAALGLIADYKAAGGAACGKDLMNGASSNGGVYGSGAARSFQVFARTCPLGAIEHAAMTLKNCPQHYGPWKTGRARAPVARCENVFKQVAALINKNRESNCQAMAITGSGAGQVAQRNANRR